MKMHKIHAAFAILLSAVLALSAAGCGSTDEKTVSTATVLYYMDKDELGITSVQYTPQKQEQSEIEAELLAKLQEAPANSSLEKLLPDDVKVNSSAIEKGVLHLDFSASYKNMGKTREVLARAGIVRTMVQIEGISYVEFTVEGSPLLDEKDEKVGLMNADSFIENTGRQINSYQHADIDLYFADSAGDMLVRETRSIYYSSNKPLEWAIMERLIAGPKVEGNGAVISSDTQIIGVSTSDGICYVNLSSEFLNTSLNINEALPIYAIVDSLTANCDVRQVQFSVDGKTDVTFGEHMNLNKLYESNTDLIQSADSSS
ncbi:MAG: GerMN domain-containing protein [Lachnospiraceae bacterium]|jgi:germination protein M|nr:GerMN domain-containing protein [Lachnospiraceae bacterium]MCI1726423.1 GerMN domain-containing protein [Lachnospiraceae bacterium]